MAKRFSLREFGLLMAPVLIIGAVGLWVSNRPMPIPDDGKPRLQFHVAPPTPLEAWQGFDGAFVVEAKNREGLSYTLAPARPYLELKTHQGVQVSRLIRGKTTGFGQRVWGNNVSNSRYAFKTRNLPPGTLSFGVEARASRGYLTSAAPMPGTRLTGKWKVDRSKIKPINLAALPHQPGIGINSVQVTELSPLKNAGSRGFVMVDIVFGLHGLAMDKTTSFNCSLLEYEIIPNTKRRSGVVYARRPGMRATHKQTPLTRVRQWFAYPSLSDTFQITGRVSADNRWPLGFEIEPFDFKTAKVGQKLKFKQFPVALPKA